MNINLFITLTLIAGVLAIAGFGPLGTIIGRSSGLQRIVQIASGALGVCAVASVILLLLFFFFAKPVDDTVVELYTISSIEPTADGYAYSYYHSGEEVSATVKGDLSVGSYSETPYLEISESGVTRTFWFLYGTTEDGRKTNQVFHIVPSSVMDP